MIGAGRGPGKPRVHRVHPAVPAQEDRRRVGAHPIEQRQRLRCLAFVGDARDQDWEAQTVVLGEAPHLRAVALEVAGALERQPQDRQAAVAVLPMLGIGGMQLYRAETPGPVKDTKLTPRITETAKALWYVYLAFTVACAASYMIAGMSWFDALCHSFSTVAIGGFSTHDMSMGYFDSTAINLVAIFFMFAAGINFSLHFFAWRYVSVKHYSQDPEFRGYFGILVGVSVLVIIWLFQHQVFGSPSETIVTGLFQAVSIATTTGFTTANFAAWPAALPVVLIFASFVGGSAGSTAGGIKVVRWLLIYKQGVREIARLVHPSAEIPVKLGNKAVGYKVVDAVWGFFSIYVVVFSVMLIAMMATGLDQVTAFSAVAATLNNLGPGLGDVSSGFMSLSDTAKWISIAGMLLGRLEIFTLLVLITPTFWRH